MPSEGDPLTWTMAEAAEAIAGRRVSSVELTKAALARAESRQPELNCFIRIEPEAALEAARQADAALARGVEPGPLHGVPLAHKDMYYDAGRVTDCASEVRRGYQPRVTATLIARMRAAGAVNLGTLNMTEFALGPTGHNAIWGDCRNPWNTTHITCGSSSGSGAAVAARIVYASLGSDTGGSTRLPAAANGLVGIKPTYSRLSRHGCMGLSFSVDTPGPVARTARDVARLFGVIAGHDPADPTSSRRAVPDYEAATNRGIQDLRIGVPENYYFDRVADDVGGLLDDALRVLDRAGARIVRLRTPEASHLAELSRALVYSEGTALHGDWLRSRGEAYSPQVRVRASTGLAIPAPVYVEALHLRPILLREFVECVFGACDVLFTPTLSIPVPTLDETDVGSRNVMWDTIGTLVHCTAPFNYLGVPALAVPVGFTRNGLPASMQLVGRPFAEARLLRTAAAYQRHTDWHERAPPLN